MPHASEKVQPNEKLSSATDGNLTALIEQCSNDVRCGLSRADFLCRMMSEHFGVLEQIDRETADWLMASVAPLIAHFTAAEMAFSRVGRLLRANAVGRSAHVDAINFTRGVRDAFVQVRALCEIPEMADTIVERWKDIRDWLLQLKRPDVEELDNRIEVERDRAIHSQANQARTSNGDSEIVRELEVKTSVTLSVVISSRQATLRTVNGEVPYDLPSEGVARWLKVLAEHPGQWIRPDDYKIHDTNLDGVKPSDKLRSLRRSKKCQRLAKLVEPSKHDGMRFNAALSVNADRAPRRATNC